MLDKYAVIENLEKTMNAIKPLSKDAYFALKAFLECVENGEFDISKTTKYLKDKNND